MNSNNMIMLLIKDVGQTFKTKGQFPAQAKIDPRDFKFFYKDLYNVTKDCNNISEAVEVLASEKIGKALRVLNASPVSKTINTKDVGGQTVWEHWNSATPALFAAHKIHAGKSYQDWDLETLKELDPTQLSLILTINLGGAVLKWDKRQDKASVVRQSMSDSRFSNLDILLNEEVRDKVKEIYDDEDFLKEIRMVYTQSAYTKKLNGWIRGAKYIRESDCDYEKKMFLAENLTDIPRLMMLEAWIYNTRKCPHTVGCPFTFKSLDEVPSRFDIEERGEVNSIKSKTITNKEMEGDLDI